MKQIEFFKSAMIRWWLALAVVSAGITACTATPPEKTKQSTKMFATNRPETEPMQIAAAGDSETEADPSTAKQDEPTAEAPTPEYLPPEKKDWVSSSNASPSSAPAPWGLTLVRDVWQRLDKATNTCGGYNYFPEGGMQSFACNVMALAPFTALYEQAQTDLFLSGPHSNTVLNLTSKKDFGHYNPEFVTWAVENLVPGSRDSAFRAATQSMYDQYVAPLARIFYFTLTKIAREPACFEKEVNRYKRALQKKNGPEDFVERYFFFMNADFCRRPDDEEYFFQNGFDGGIDGNVTKTCVGFWIRRHLDGTKDQFSEGLGQLLLAYEPALLENDSEHDANDSDVFVPGIPQPKKKRRPSILKPITPSDFHGKPAHLR